MLEVVVHDPLEVVTALSAGTASELVQLRGPLGDLLVNTLLLCTWRWTALLLLLKVLLPLLLLLDRRMLLLDLGRR